MDNKNFQNQNEVPETKGKAKLFWRNFGLFFLALGIATLTVVVISL